MAERPQRALRDVLLHLRLRLRGVRAGPGLQVLGRVVIYGPGRVCLGRDVVLDGRDAPVELHTLRKGAEIHLGDGVVVHGGASLEADACIRVGARCELGPFAKLLDNNFHPLKGNRHARPAPSPVTLDEDVHLEREAIVLPGTHLQRGVRVCAGSLVSRKVPPGVTVSGVPATRVRTTPIPGASS